MVSEVGGEAAPALAPAAQEAREIMAYLGAISVPPGANAQLNVSAGESIGGDAQRALPCVP